MKFVSTAFMLAVTAGVSPVAAGDGHSPGHAAVSDQLIAEQQQKLSANTKGKGFGPQSPRQIDVIAGSNPIRFAAAPASSSMNLCNIHMHKNAEHAGGEFSKYAGNGDGHGHGSGYVYSGALSAEELKPSETEVCPSEHGALKAGDTIELHYVHSSAQVSPGVTLGACFNDAIKNPALRVEAQVLVLVNDSKALDFGKLTALGMRNGFHQALNIPADTGTPVQYAGSTTGPAFNEAGSPYQVSWSVRPKVAKVNLKSVGEWCKANVFKEDHAHGVRNLVKDPALLSAPD